MAKCHLSWDSYQKNISSGLADLQQHEEFVDMTIAAAGHLVKVHRNLLALASPYIKAMLQSAPCPHPVIFLSNINEETLAHILEYVYTGEVLMPTQKMDAFIKACGDLHIIGIENVKPPKLPPDINDKVLNESQPNQQQTKITSNNTLTNERLLIESIKAKKRKLDQNYEDFKIIGTTDNTALEKPENNTEKDSLDKSHQQQEDEIVKTEALVKAERLRKMIEHNDATEIDVDLMEDPVAHQSRVDHIAHQSGVDKKGRKENLGLIESHAFDDDVANFEVNKCDVKITSDQSGPMAPVAHQSRVDKVEGPVENLGLIDSHSFDDDIDNIEMNTCDVRKTSDELVPIDPIIAHQSRVDVVEGPVANLGLIEPHVVDDNIANIKVNTCNIRKTSNQSVTTAPNSQNFAKNIKTKRKYVKKKIIPQQCYLLRRSQKKSDDKQNQETETTQASEQVCGAENESAVISKTIIARKASDIKIKKINDTFRLVTNSKENISCEAAEDGSVSDYINSKIEPIKKIKHSKNVTVDFELSIGAHVIEGNTEIVNLPKNIQQDQLLNPDTDLLFIPTNIENEKVTSTDTFSHNYMEKNQTLGAITDLPFIPTSPINEIDTNNSIDYGKAIENNNKNVNIDIEASNEYNNVNVTLSQNYIQNNQALDTVTGLPFIPINEIDTCNSNENVNIDIEPNREYNNVDEPFDYMDVEQSINNEFSDQNIPHATDMNKNSNQANDMIENTDQNSSYANDIVVKAVNKCKTYEDCVKEFIEDPSINEEAVINDQLDSVPDNGALYNVNVELPSGSQSVPRITVLTTKINNQYMPMFLTEHLPASEEAESTKPQANLPDPNKLITSTEPLFTVNGFGKLQLILNRFIYCTHHTSLTKRKWRWRCIDYRHHNCRAYVDTVEGEVVGRKNDHEHPFHDKKILKLGQNKQFFSSLKEIQDIVGEPMDKLIYLDLGFLNNLPKS